MRPPSNAQAGPLLIFLEGLRHVRKQGQSTISTRVSILRGRELSASDPRDNLYCLLSLMNPAQARAIGSDYTLSPAEVYAKATFTSLEYEGHSRIFNHVGPIYRRLSTPDIACLPTWAVNFQDIIGRRSIHRPSTYMEYSEVAGPDIDVFHKSASPDLPRVFLDDTLRRLTIPASWVAVVWTVRDTIPTSSPSLPDHMTWQCEEREAFLIGALTSFIITTQLGAGESAASVDRLIAQERCRVLLQDIKAQYTSEEDIFEAWHLACSQLCANSKSSWNMSGIRMFISRMASRLKQGKAFTLPSGLMGLGPLHMEPGDTVIMFPRGNFTSVPFSILRPTAEPGVYNFVGQAYVHGPLFAAFWEQPWASQYVERQFVIV